MILCDYCSWESYQEKEYEEATKTWTNCSGCKEVKRCAWW